MIGFEAGLDVGDEENALSSFHVDVIGSGRQYGSDFGWRVEERLPSNEASFAKS